MVVLAIDQPAPPVPQVRAHAETDRPRCDRWAQIRVSDELLKPGVTVSPFGVRCIWLRHDLATMKHRLNALEAKMTRERLILAESRLAALEKAKADKGKRDAFTMAGSRANVRAIAGRRTRSMSAP